MVVSAMGDTTDELLALARQRHAISPARRELDMLLSAGERISMALLSMALNARGVPAVSFTGSQSGIITNDAHTTRASSRCGPFRVQDELARGKVVIVAGYQGVSYQREVTTLGRGGSDTTAVALAAALERRGLRDLQRRGRRLLGRPARGARGAPAVRDLVRGDAGAGRGRGEGPERAGGGVREGGGHRHLRPRHERQRRRNRRPPLSAQGSRARGGCRERDGVDAPGGRTLPARGAGRCSQLLDERGIAGKQLQSPRVATASGPRLSSRSRTSTTSRRTTVSRRRRFSLHAGIGAVSAIGTGINATFGNVRRALAALAEQNAGRPRPVDLELPDQRARRGALAGCRGETPARAPRGSDARLSRGRALSGRGPSA